MLLSPRDLQAPHRQARPDPFSLKPPMSRIEASFFNGDEDQMQQWLDCGVLEKLMQDRTRSPTRYLDLLPLRLLESAKNGILEGSSRISLESAAKWWGTLMSLRRQDRPLPTSEWMASGACLPWDIFDDWIDQGSSPHALAKSLHRAPSSRASPFLELLATYISLSRRVGRKNQTRPSRSEILKLCKKRLEQWALLPGMVQDHADRALFVVSYHALSNPKLPSGDLDFLGQLRDRMIAQGAACTDAVVKEVLIPALAPPRPPNPYRARIRSLWKIEQDRQELETLRLSPAHQGLVSQWATVLASTDAQSKNAVWRKDQRVFFELLAGGCLPAALAMLDRSPDLFEVSYSRQWMPQGNEDFDEARLAAKLRGLSDLAGHPAYPGEKWLERAAVDIGLSSPSIGVVGMDACLGVFKGNARQGMVKSWMSACVINSKLDATRTSQVLSLLNDHGALDLALCPPGCVEGSETDLAEIRQGGLSSWLLDDSLASLLRDMPAPIGSRAITLSLFFADGTLPQDKMSDLLSKALVLSPQLLRPALGHHISRIGRRPDDVRATRSIATIKALASLGAGIQEDQVPSLWEEVATSFAPRPDMDRVCSDMSDIARNLTAIAPLSKSKGQPLLKLLEIQGRQQARDLLSRSPLRDTWPKLSELVGELVVLGVDLDCVVVEDPSTPLGKVIISHQQGKALADTTIASYSRPVRRF